MRLKSYIRIFVYPNVDSMLNELIRRCMADMESAATSGETTIEAQVRAYDLQAVLLDPGMYSEPDLSLASAYVEIYEKNLGKLDGLDMSVLKADLDNRLESLRTAMNEARFEAAAAASLHEFAKDVFDTWQNSGIFARRRALRELRERAGFRLESHRIGNYVAKTFDLQNEAQARFARAQQAVFAADVTYKLKPGLYAFIYELLKSR